MKLPTSLAVIHLDLEVVPMSPVETQAQNIRGRFLPAQDRIEIWEGQTDAGQVESLLHEALHAIWVTIDLPKDPEEKVVSRLAPQIMLLCRQNPKLRDLLFPPTLPA